MPYVSGAKYIRNTLTGAVFEYRDSIVGRADLEVMTADAGGNLVKVVTKAEDTTAKLNPTKTPEKKEAPASKPPTSPVSKQPTMKPVDA